MHLADRTREALEAINETEALAERFEQRYYCAELHRLRGVFLATLGADETQIEASLCEAIKTATEQKSVSLAERAEARYQGPSPSQLLVSWGYPFPYRTKVQ